MASKNLDVIYNRQGRKLSNKEVIDLELSVILIVARDLGMTDGLSLAEISNIIGCSSEFIRQVSAAGESGFKENIDKSWYEEEDWYIGANQVDIEKEVFEHWRAVMGKTNQARFTKGRARAIKARLKEGYTAEELKLAIDGCAKSSWHMGNNSDGKVYNDLELICRKGEHVERFIGYNYKVTTIITGSTKTKDVSIGQSINDTSWAL